MISFLFPRTQTESNQEFFLLRQKRELFPETRRPTSLPHPLSGEVPTETRPGELPRRSLAAARLSLCPAPAALLCSPQRPRAHRRWPAWGGAPLAAPPGPLSRSARIALLAAVPTAPPRPAPHSSGRCARAPAPLRLRPARVVPPRPGVSSLNHRCVFLFPVWPEFFTLQGDRVRVYFV